MQKAWNVFITMMLAAILATMLFMAKQQEKTMDIIHNLNEVDANTQKSIKNLNDANLLLNLSMLQRKKRHLWLISAIRNLTRG